MSTLIWGATLGSRSAQRLPDIVCGENVPSFDLPFWTSLSSHNYDWHATVLGPDMIGIAVSGERLWWVGFSRQLSESLATADVLSDERVTRTLRSRVIMDPTVFLKASRLQAEMHEDFINSHGAKVPTHPRGKRLRPEDYLGCNAQCRLLEHRHNACSLRLRNPSLHSLDFFFDISQHVSHSRCPSNGHLPRPTTSSTIWSEAFGRMVHPLEHWLAQGLPY